MGRKIAIVLVGLVFLGAVALFAVERFAAEVLFKPDHAFAGEMPSQVPDYSDLANWSAWPGRDDAGDRLPEGVVAPPEGARSADVFYVHPTTYLKKDSWNAAIDDQITNMLVDELPVLGQATAFNNCCRVFAPRYRQATLWTFMSAADDNKAALDLAYQDVERAFDYFVGAIPADRPIVLASHSQGTHHLTRLLSDRIVGQPIADRIVIVYAIGGGMYAETPDRGLDGFPFCETKDDIRCIITWDAMDVAKSNGRVDSDTALPRWLDGGYNMAHDTALGCVNPLTMLKAGDDADFAYSKGFVELDSSEFGRVFMGGKAPPIGTKAKLSAPMPGAVAAKCVRRGLLVDVSKIADKVGSALPGGSLHLHDFSLFYMDIFEDAPARVAKFLAAD